MPAPENIHQLVRRFEEHHGSYRSGKYNETQLRREFLDPFFEALGWDVFNRQGYAEAYKDVIHEDLLEIKGATKAPVYAFRIRGQYLEQEEYDQKRTSYFESRGYRVIRFWNNDVNEQHGVGVESDLGCAGRAEH